MKYTGKIKAVDARLPNADYMNSMKCCTTQVMQFKFGPIIDYTQKNRLARFQIVYSKTSKSPALDPGDESRAPNCKKTIK